MISKTREVKNTMVMEVWDRSSETLPARNACEQAGVSGKVDEGKALAKAGQVVVALSGTSCLAAL